MAATVELRCACGQVHIQVEGDPIVSAECHCDSCRQAGAQLQPISGGRQILEANGGTRFVLFRKDRVRFVVGAALLKEFRPTPTSPTRRVLASCCGSPVFLEFMRGHWLSLYGSLWQKGSLPPIELRTMTSDLPNTAHLSADVPNARYQTFSFFRKLLMAWMLMGFRAPKISVSGKIEV